MAYTRNLNSGVPLGSAQVSGGDDSIRALALDLQERLVATFVDPNADPMVIKDTSLPAAAGGILIIPGTALQPAHDEDDVEYHEDFYRADNNVGSFATAGFWLPAGNRITLIEVLADKFAAASFDTKLWAVDFTTGVASLITTVNHATAGIGVTPSGALAELTGNDKFFQIQVEAGGAAGFFNVYAFRITYVQV